MIQKQERGRNTFTPWLYIGIMVILILENTALYRLIY